MRYLAIAAVLVVLAGACGDDDVQPLAESAARRSAPLRVSAEDATPADRVASGATCLPPPSVENDVIARMVLSDDDVPAEIAILGEATVARGVKCTSSDSTTTAARQYDSPDLFPPYGAQRVIVTASVHSSITAAEQMMEWASEDISLGNLERLLAPEWHLLSYEDLDGLVVGQERKVIHYVAANAEGLVFLETYWATFRRDNVTAVLNIRAPLDNISREQFGALAAKLDQRLQEGLLSLQ